MFTNSSLQLKDNENSGLNVQLEVICNENSSGGNPSKSIMSMTLIILYRESYYQIVIYYPHRAWE